MKTSQQILDLIQVKINEHALIVGQMKKDLESMRGKMAEIAQLDPKNKEAIFTQTTLVMTLKDRLMFHKACILQLNDLIKEINE